ncbi:MAG: EAL domain-containing protein [Gammaproteobacteria bacterium]|nr:EAL domain-containing protein [Gammaproteobacteria bacterium]
MTNQVVGISMLGDVFQLALYQVNGYSIPLFAAAALILFMSALTLAYERGSRVASPLFVLALSTSWWLAGFGMMYCSQNLELALWWCKAAHIGIVFLPTTALYFTANVVGRDNFSAGRSLTFAASVSMMFLVLVYISPDFISGIERRWWGPYPFYGPVGSTFVVFLVMLFATCIGLFWTSLRSAPRDTSMHRRSKLFMVAFIVGTTSIIDFLPMYDVDIFPVGRITMLCLFTITTYVTWRYRLVDLTPSFVGQQIAETMTDALIVMDRDEIVRLTNRSACRMLGRSQEEMLGQSLSATLGDNFVAFLETLSSGKPLRDVETCVLDSMGKSKTISLSGSIMRDRYQKPVAFVYTIRDISQRKAAEDRIRQLAYFDVLTDLPNRAQSNEQFEKCLQIAGEKDIPVTALFIDLDRFKRINDTLGHSAGDELLQQVATRLGTCVREYDVLAKNSPDGAENFVARLGGDEFVICLFDVYEIQEIDKINKRILLSMAEPFQLGQHEVFITASIGVSRFPDDGNDVSSLLKNADTAMYHAKNTGRDGASYYDAAMSATAMDRLSLEADLRKALERGEFSLAYQPQVDKRTDSIIGAEALLRWNHPVRGMVPPDDFIPLAEETGLIAPIGEWVLNEACRQTSEWHRAGYDSLMVAVNLSERQFRRDNLLQVVTNALLSSALPPEFLDLELTESMIMQNASSSIETLAAINTMGIKISVDDFGTGYSSLSYLKRFPIDVLKVDQSFVSDIATNVDVAAITSAIIAMARSLHIDVIAEGVETPAQMNHLIEQGCTKMQGYMLGRPMSAVQFRALLDEEPVKAKDSKSTVVSFAPRTPVPLTES